MISGTGDPEDTIMSLGVRHPRFGKHHLCLSSGPRTNAEVLTLHECFLRRGAGKTGVSEYQHHSPLKGIKGASPQNKAQLTFLGISPFGHGA